MTGVSPRTPNRFPGARRIAMNYGSKVKYRTMAKAVADLSFQGYFAREFMPAKDPMTSLRQAIEICTA
jgi:hydroxypyruvate isomerase